MPSILTQHYRSSLAGAFLNKLQVWEAIETVLAANANAISSNTLATIHASGVGPEVLYLCVGYSQEWSDTSNAIVNDVNPPVPTESVQTLSFDVWKHMIGAKRVYTANINYVIPRVDWTANTIYGQYDDLATDLHTKNLFVLDTSDLPYRVYKCLWNNGGVPSTNSPSLTVGDSLSPIETLDGYVWKYMYTLPTIRDKYLTTSWMPVYTDANVVAEATRLTGTLPTAVPLVVANGGVYSENVIASPLTVTIYGDGIGATVNSDAVSISGNTIQSIVLHNGGNNYTKIHTINVYQSGATSAVVRAIIPPYRNHGYDIVRETFAKHLMVSMVLGDSTDNISSTSTGLTRNNDYRQVSLVVNPLEYALLSNVNACPIATKDFYRQSYDITLSANTGPFTPDDAVYTMAQVDGNGRVVAPNGIVVDAIMSYGNVEPLIIRVASVQLEGVTDPFPANSVIKCNVSTSEGTVASVSPPELAPYRGEIIYLNQRVPVSRVSGQSEEIKIVLPFGG